MKKIILLLPLLFALNLKADPIQDVDRNFPFKALFDRDLYDFTKVNEYDRDPLQPNQVVHIGADLNETAEQKIARLKQRKKNQLNKKIILPITQYLVTLNKKSLKSYAQKGLLGVGSSLGAGYWFAEKGGEKAAEETAKVVANNADELATAATKAIVDNANAAGEATSLGGKVAQVIAENVDDVAGAAATGSGGGAAAANSASGGFNWGAFGLTVAANVGVNVLVEMLNEGPERQKTTEGNLLINSLRQKMATEEVQALEEDYIKRYSEYDQEWRQAIEKALLATRKEQGAMNNTDRIELARELLQFPTRTKLLPPTYTLGDDDFAQKTKAFVTQAFEPNDKPENLSYYKGAVRKKLENVLSDVCKCSKVAASNGDGQRRKSYVFYGIPGTGKSVAAKLIAEATQLPVYHLDIANREDFSSAALYGSDNILNRSKGHLPQAFLKTNEAGERSNNIIVILDDVDRAFPKDPATGRILDQDGLLKKLLELFDKNKKDFTAGCYGVKRDMRDVIFIATTNTDFDAAEHGTMFNALKSRARVIRFEPPGADEKKDRIKNYLTDDMFEDSLAFSDEQDQWDTIRQAIANFIIDHYDTEDNREMERRAEDLLNEPQDEWENVAENSGWQSNDAQQEPGEQADDSDEDDD